MPDVSFGPLLFIVGLFLIVMSPVMGFIAIRSGNVIAAISWWMIGTCLGAGLLMTEMV